KRHPNKKPGAMAGLLLVPGCPRLLTTKQVTHPLGQGEPAIPFRYPRAPFNAKWMAAARARATNPPDITANRTRSRLDVVRVPRRRKITRAKITPAINGSMTRYAMTYLPVGNSA